jgi:hypothetical protein
MLDVTGSDGGLSGRCLAQHGCRGPQGISAGAGITEASCRKRECIPGQQEWPSAIEAKCSSGRPVRDGMGKTGTTGKLHHVREASAKAAMSLLDIFDESR